MPVAFVNPVSMIIHNDHVANRLQPAAKMVVMERNHSRQFNHYLNSLNNEGLWMTVRNKDWKYLDDIFSVAIQIIFDDAIGYDLYTSTTPGYEQIIVAINRPHERHQFYLTKNQGETSE